MPNDPLSNMTALDGTAWSPSTGGPNPDIQQWLRDIAAAYPNMASYCNSVINDNYFSWCGLTVAYCMTKAGFAPVFKAGDELNSFLWAAAWLGWGTPVTGTPQPGDAVVFDFGGGDHHVTLFQKDNGNGTWACHGGNQSHTVNVTNFQKSSVMGVRRATAGGALPQVASGTLAPSTTGRAVTALQSALASKGFDPGGIDGEYGPLTSAAVSAFQRANNIAVTGIADPATLLALGVSTDTTPPPQDGTTTATTGGPTMQWQDILTTLVNALITKQTGVALPGTPTPTTPTTQGPADIMQILQTAIAALAGKPLPTTTTTTPPATATTPVTTPPVLSIIDQIFGGQALAGKKTMLAIIAYVIFAILQATQQMGPVTGADASHTSQVILTLISAFGALGGLAKVDRLTQMLGAVAGQSTTTQTKT